MTDLHLKICLIGQSAAVLRRAECQSTNAYAAADIKQKSASTVYAYRIHLYFHSSQTI